MCVEHCFANQKQSVTFLALIHRQNNLGKKQEIIFLLPTGSFYNEGVSDVNIMLDGITYPR